MPKIINCNPFIERSGEVPLHSTLRLSNDSTDSDILFRVQTTSPATYRVRPSHGRIASGGQIEIQVVMVSDPVKADKFLVKFVTIPHTAEQDDFMKMFTEAADPQERRLRVNLIAAEESPTHSTSNAASSIVGGGEKMEEISVGSESAETMTLELREARSKIQVLVTKNQELSKALEEMKKLRNRNEANDATLHPATKLDRGISETELNQLISAQAGFPPVLVILIALFAFLLGLLF
jgi:hypothetical protein